MNGHEISISSKPSHRKPLDKFAIIRTSDIDEMKDAVGRYFGENRLNVARGHKDFRAHGNYLQLDAIGISFGSFGTAVEFHFPDFPIGYTVPIVHAGSGEAKTGGRTVPVGNEQTAIYAPGKPLTLFYGEAFETVNVQLGRKAVTRKLGSLLGFQPERELVFEPVFDFRQPANAFWGRLIDFLIGEADAHGAGLPRTAMAEMEQALLVTFLQSNPHNFSHLLGGRLQQTAPWQVRRAEDYIEAHWDQPITIEALAAATNSSARSLFHSFKESRGYSPMAFARQVRLRRARAMLAKPGPAASVTDVAYTCGFSNLGNFAKEYARAFGERPSETLNAARGVAALLTRQGRKG